MHLLAYADSKCPDQPAHLGSLIRAFTEGLHCLLTESLDMLTDSLDTTEYMMEIKDPDDTLCMNTDLNLNFAHVFLLDMTYIIFFFCR